ncbi:MAG: hypothetical protein HY730_09335 [Candidatus Tectomicrobia bacterium]|uniref:Uncharacterized protein n=1 Tax=Tectimicrobiota bacterium TaxID=2528274 RepID=A0A933GNF3_UNCTE|nr:hypothetical protein [Candidatus Tectomicrobia bacterium]
MKTSLEVYFSPNISAKLRESYAIKSMEQLISLTQRASILSALAKEIGMNYDVFEAIIAEARRTLGVIEHSGRKYPLGALFPSDKD